ncbi:hypothetical protein MIND_01052200 [Mycena indigotica]|uniref:Uncharacterized protein n=1 Tax=Mycena indigotica TaxID=2126181 RepID=A0A8H6SB84_9AGAR|nr:uncharacterized protein MIND_01052200 [Mycena indigotica]KAF7295137.1 hypothetical protein MIND_01052200 [Mycena indigotica]
MSENPEVKARNDMNCVGDPEGEAQFALRPNSKKFGKWLDSDKAYYLEARIKIVETLTVAEHTLRRDHAVLVAEQRAKLCQAFLAIVAIIRRYMHHFTEPDLLDRLHKILSTVPEWEQFLPPHQIDASNSPTPTPTSVTPPIGTAYTDSVVEPSVLPISKTLRKTKRRKTDLDKLVEEDARSYKQQRNVHLQSAPVSDAFCAPGSEAVGDSGIALVDSEAVPENTHFTNIKVDHAQHEPANDPSTAHTTTLEPLDSGSPIIEVASSLLDHPANLDSESLEETEITVGMQNFARDVVMKVNEHICLNIPITQTQTQTRKFHTSIENDVP